MRGPWPVARCYRRLSITWLERRSAALLALPGSSTSENPAREVCNVANIKSQKKRILTNAKAAERNKAVKSELKTRSKNAVARDRQRDRRRVACDSP